MSSAGKKREKKISCIVSPDAKIIHLSRTDGTRGPLGVAKAISSRFVDVYSCDVVNLEGGIDLLKALLGLLLVVRDYSVCIHANGYRLPLLLHVISRFNRSNRYYCVIHGIVNIEKRYHPVSAKDTKLEPYVFRNFQNIICVSEFEKEKLLSLYGERGNVSVIHNGVAFEAVPNQEKAAASPFDFVCISTGGFEQGKGVDLALGVLAKLSKLGCKPKLIVCGRDSAETGSNRRFCERMAEENGIELDYRGEIHDKSVLESLYQEAHFYMGLSRFDTFNCSILEGAMAGCVPVVSTNCGARELFDGDSSIICDISSEDSLRQAAKKMGSLLGDGSYPRVSSKANKVAHDNNWNAVSEKYWGLLSGA